MSHCPRPWPVVTLAIESKRCFQMKYSMIIALALGAASILYLEVATVMHQDYSDSSAVRSLPATGECVTNDMRVVGCSADAAMSMDDFKRRMKSVCNSLDDTRISEMTSKELRIQEACRAVTGGGFFDNN
jgi:hypothetical protein